MRTGMTDVSYDIYRCRLSTLDPESHDLTPRVTWPHSCSPCAPPSLFIHWIFWQYAASPTHACLHMEQLPLWYTLRKKCSLGMKYVVWHIWQKKDLGHLWICNIRNTNITWGEREKLQHAESSGVIQVGKLLSYFAWPVPVTLLRVYLSTYNSLELHLELHLFLSFLPSLFTGEPFIKSQFPPIFNEIDGEPVIFFNKIDGVPVTGLPDKSRAV